MAALLSIIVNNISSGELVITIPPKIKFIKIIKKLFSKSFFTRRRQNLKHQCQAKPLPADQQQKKEQQPIPK